MVSGRNWDLRLVCSLGLSTQPNTLQPLVIFFFSGVLASMSKFTCGQKQATEHNRNVHFFNLSSFLVLPTIGEQYTTEQRSADSPIVNLLLDSSDRWIIRFWISISKPISPRELFWNWRCFSIASVYGLSNGLLLRLGLEWLGCQIRVANIEKNVQKVLSGV